MNILHFHIFSHCIYLLFIILRFQLLSGFLLKHVFFRSVLFFSHLFPADHPRGLRVRHSDRGWGQAPHRFSGSSTQPQATRSSPPPPSPKKNIEGWPLLLPFMRSWLFIIICPPSFCVASSILSRRQQASPFSMLRICLCWKGILACRGISGLCLHSAESAARRGNPSLFCPFHPVVFTSHPSCLLLGVGCPTLILFWENIWKIRIFWEKFLLNVEVFTEQYVSSTMSMLWILATGCQLVGGLGDPRRLSGLFGGWPQVLGWGGAFGVSLPQRMGRTAGGGPRSQGGLMVNA